MGIGAPKVVTSDAQHERYVAELLKLERLEHPTSAQKDLAKLLAVLIAAYEENRYAIRPASPVEVLSELLEANRLRQKDLVSIFGAESTVSAVLSGHRSLTKRHIEKLSQRFKVSPAVFFET